MIRKSLKLIAAFITATVVVLSSFPIQGGFAASTARPNAAPVTTITVDSGLDINTSKSETCLTKVPCTLRRAIVQARNLSASQKPVLIAFDIPKTSGNGFITALKIWKIELLSTSDPSVLRRLNGDIIIDGSTQPGGRTNGPKIFLVGPGGGNRDGLIVGDIAGDNNHVIRGLGFQNFKTHIYVNTDNNLIEDNWFGLNNAGNGVYLRNGNPQDGSGNTGISLTSGADNNTIQDNVITGLDGVAAAIDGEKNTFASNYVGTAANGNVPSKATAPSQICTTVDWLGGGGISISGVIYSGTNHVIENNVFAGLRQEIFAGSTQPEAISVHGTRHLIQNNRIGIEVSGTAVGVCGRGIYLIGSPHDMEVRNNRIANTGLSAISLNDPLFDAVLLRGNTIRKSTAWPQVQGNPKPEDAIQLGPSLPDAFELFTPAKVISIQGTAVSGTHGDGSPCPNCIIEIFLDDTDGIVEALRSLAVVTAKANGKWTATLATPLTANQGLRTTSTTAAFGTIPGISANTTTGLSSLYTSGGAGGLGKVYLPLLGK